MVNFDPKFKDPSRVGSSLESSSCFGRGMPKISLGQVGVLAACSGALSLLFGLLQTLGVISFLGVMGGVALWSGVATLGLAALVLIGVLIHKYVQAQRQRNESCQPKKELYLPKTPARFESGEQYLQEDLHDPLEGSASKTPFDTVRNSAKRTSCDVVSDVGRDGGSFPEEDFWAVLQEMTQEDVQLAMGGYERLLNRKMIQGMEDLLGGNHFMLAGDALELPGDQDSPLASAEPLARLVSRVDQSPPVLARRVRKVRFADPIEQSGAS